LLVGSALSTADAGAFLPRFEAACQPRVHAFSGNNNPAAPSEQRSLPTHRSAWQQRHCGTTWEDLRSSLVFRREKGSAQKHETRAAEWLARVSQFD